MNNTKKLTTGAMLLAIIGALMLIDRQLSFMFETFIIMFMPVVIIIYSTMYDLKAGALLSFCLLVLTFVLGDPEYAFINVPIAVIVGMGYSVGVKKNLDKSKLMIIAMVLFIIGEIVVAFIVTPLLGFSIPQQIASIQEMYGEMMGPSNMGLNVFEQMGINISSLLLVLLVLSTILLGIMEGFIIHILSLFLLQRFKIKNIDRGNIISYNLHPAVAYISFLAFGAMMFIPKFDNETIKLIIVVFAMIGSMILLYYGYLFVIVYLRIVTQKKSIGFIVIIVMLLTIPFSIVALIIIGFLYGAGPLKSVLENKGFRQ